MTTPDVYKRQHVYFLAVVVNLLIISSVFFIVCYVCAHTLLLNSIIHFKMCIRDRLLPWDMALLTRM